MHSREGGKKQANAKASRSKEAGKAGAAAMIRRPSQLGFGGIAKSVIQAANATAASGNAPVKRLEELFKVS